MRVLRPLAAAVIAAVLTGAAAAATITGTQRADVLRGTPRADVLSGLGGADRLSGAAGADFLWGGRGADRLDAGPGADRVQAQDGARDRVTCGTGADIATADLTDTVAADCETVTRLVARDSAPGGSGQFSTTAESDTASFSSTVVSAFQVGRIAGGAADTVGFATSRDAGRTWSSGLLPGLSQSSPSPGPDATERITDPSVAYDAVHGVWLASTLAVGSALSGLPINRSSDGVTWSLPVYAALVRGGPLAFDKNWITCDNGSASPLRGRCYLAYTDTIVPGIVVQTTADGGLTWSAGVRVPQTSPPSAVVGAFPVVRANGELLVLHRSGNALVSARSADGGASFAAPDLVAPLQTAPVPGMRAPALPSADVDAAGVVHVAWHDCRFRATCDANDLVLASSSDGRSWSPPVRVPGVPNAASAFLPGLAVAGGAGAPPQLALVYYAMPRAACTTACLVDAYLLTTRADGTWRAPRRLNAQSMRLGWMPFASGGRMLGDYLSASFAGGRVTTVLALAAPPESGRFDQQMYAATLDP